MANVKISNLTAATTPVAGTEVLPIVQSGSTVKVSIANLTPGLSTITTAKGGTGLTSFTSGGVVYASSSSALTTGSALVFDGTNLGIGTSSPSFKLDVAGGGARIIPSGGSANTPESGAGTLNVYGATSSITTRSGALRLETFSNMAADVGTGISFSTRYITSPNDGSYTIAKIGGYKQNATTSNGAGYLAFATSTGPGDLTERMRINSTGALVFAGGTTTANGIGITFPATQSASTDANTLDDYEEGTWTPSFSNLTVVNGTGGATFSGTYTKIGRVVYITAIITVTGSCTTTATASTFINNLPFTAAGLSTLGAMFYSTSSSIGIVSVNGSSATNASMIPWIATNSTVVISGFYNFG